MSFLFPALLGFSALAALPIIFHLTGRRQASTLPFGAYAFLEEVVLRLSRREHIRQMVLLALRVLAILAIALAAAAPIKRFAAVATESHDLLLVVDTSHSMLFVPPNSPSKRSLFERAKTMAQKVITDSGADQVLVVAAGGEARLMQPSPTADRGLAKQSLEALPTPSGSADIALAIQRGLEQMNERAVEVVVVSDLQRTSFLGKGVLEGKSISRLRLLDAAERKPNEELVNVAISKLRVEQLADGHGTSVIQVSVHNYANQPVSSELRLTLDNEVKARSFAELGPLGSQDVVFTVSDLGLGLHRGTVDLSTANDGFAVDNRADVVVEILAEPKVLLVNGDPRSVPFRDELFYVERALQAATPPLSFTTIGHEDFAQANLSEFTVVLLANMPAPRDSVAAKLTEFVRNGGGLFVALGDRVAFESYNAVWPDLLPAKLRDQFALVDPKSSDANAQALGLTQLDWSHPVLRRFDAASEPGFSQSHTYRLFYVESSLAPSTRVLARFTSGVPALLEHSVERGRAMMWVASLDRDFTDLPIRPVFAPMLALSLRYLGGALRGAPEQTVMLGEEVMLNADPASAWELRLIDDKKPLALSADRKRATPTAVGAYALYNKDKMVPGSAFSVIESLGESDFAAVDTKEVAARFGATQSAIASSSDPTRPFEPLSQFAMAALAIIFVTQSVIARRG